MKESTARFLASMNAMNDRIAADEAAVAEPKTDVDPVRIERDAERRARLGQLRAIEHPRSRPKNAVPVFGHINLGPE